MKSENLLVNAGSLIRSKSAYTETVIALSASLFLALLAKVSLTLPFSPIPITLQTFGVFFLVGSLGKKRAMAAVFAYLMEASFGLPVLSGGLSDPFWLIGPKAGYLIGFFACAYVSGTLLEKMGKSSFIWNCISLSLGSAVIYLLGAAVLSLFVGLKAAFSMGVLPFLGGDLLKILAASCATVSVKKAKALFN